MQRALPIAIAIFLCGMVSFALSRLDHVASPPHSSAPPEPSAAPIAPPPPPSTGPEDPVAHLDGLIAFYSGRGAAGTATWLDWEFVAIYSMDRARMTGDYTDWQRAESALTSAFEAGGNGFGPYLTRANFNSSMHRIDRVEADLDSASHAILLSSADRGAILSMRADARYYGGRYDEARTLYEEQLVANRRSPDALGTMAQLEWHTGHFDTAESLLDEAMGRTNADPVMGAWVLSLRATLERDRNRLDAGLAAIARAHALRPNDPHLDELAAELHELGGDDDQALHDFRAVAARTSSPQSIDGAARILRARGDTIEADELVRVARQSYDAQIALFPEAAYGHAIDHWLRLEPDDVDRMITIAEGNAEARPYGETRVKLAMAYVLADRIADARAVLDAVLATEWSTFELHAVNAIVLEREGRDASAEQAAAEAIAPGASDRLAWLTTRQ